MRVAAEMSFASDTLGRTRDGEGASRSRAGERMDAVEMHRQHSHWRSSFIQADSSFRSRC
jgi:hypothetical protein